MENPLIIGVMGGGMADPRDAKKERAIPIFRFSLQIMLDQFLTTAFQAAWLPSFQASKHSRADRASLS